jgi:hypothetical protein
LPFDFGFEKEVVHHSEAEQIRFRLVFPLSALDEQGGKLGINVEYGLEFHFRIENFSDFMKGDEYGDIHLDVAMVATVLGMAYSIARGIIFERTRSTFFDGIIIPVIDSYEILLEGQVK